jgi:chromosome partitioning protein
MVASVAVLPCGPSAADAWALASSIELVQEAMTMRPDLKACVVITRRKSRTALGKGAREMLEAGGLPVLTAELGDRVSYQEAIAAGLGVSRYAPKDAATKEIRALLDELITFAGEANEKATTTAKKTTSPRSPRS